MGNTQTESTTEREPVEYVEAETVPGVVMVDGVACQEVGGVFFPVIGVVRNGSEYIPVLDIPLVDDLPRTNQEEK